jgi:prepilin-type N-terminal cleavage/methylation domain-containing protein
MSGKRNGFTIAELLISMSILSVISSFFIVKTITVYNNRARNAIFKEFISTWSQAVYEGVLTGDLAPTKTGWNNYFGSKLNAVRICTNDTVFSQGCWTASMVGTFGEGAIVLPNGVHVAGIRNNNGLGQYSDGIIVDYNGPNGPNVWGEDTMHIAYCTSNAPGCGGLLTKGSTKAGGVGVATWYKATESTLLWDEIMQ